MAPSARFRRAHPRGKNCGGEHRKTGRLLLPPLLLPLGLGPPRAGNGAWVTERRLCRKNVDYEIPDAAQRGGGQIEQSRSGTERPFIALILFFARFLSGAFARESSFYALLFAGLQVEGVTLDLLDDVFLLHLAFEAAEGIF
jgi:hypothetical protein